MNTKSPRVFSIQSHVVSGYVGNKSVTFPLQVLGFEVDSVNSVQFSNHTWYKGGFKGQVLDANDLEDLYSGLKANSLNEFSHVLTGYIGSDSFLLKVCDIVKELKEKNTSLKYVCDPVMGDDGVMYVPESLLPIYRDHVIPLADIVLPNQYEAEKLTGTTIRTEEDALKTMEALHAKGPATVILTSTNIQSSDKIVGYASVRKGTEFECYKMEVPRLDCMFIGSGDLCAALFLAWSHRLPDSIQTVINKVQSTMHAVLDRTYKHGQAAAAPGSKPDWSEIELKLIQSKHDIEDPPPTAVITKI